MAFKFVPSIREFEIELPDDATIKVKIPYASERKQSDDFFMACIAGWTGIVDADGKELEFTEENKRLIFLEMSENKKLSEKFFSCFGGISGGFRHI